MKKNKQEFLNIWNKISTVLILQKINSSNNEVTNKYIMYTVLNFNKIN